MITYILVGLVVAALVVFFLTRKKKPSYELPEADASPLAGPSLQAPTGAPPKGDSVHPGDNRVSSGDSVPQTDAEPQRVAPQSVDSAEASGEAPAQDAGSRDVEGSAAADSAPRPLDPSLAIEAPAPVLNELEPVETENLSLRPVLDDAEEHEEPGSPPPPPERSETPVETGLGRKPELQSLRRGLAKSRQAEGFFGRLKSLFQAKKEIDPAIAEEIEEVLLTSDVGVQTTETILERIKNRLKKGELKEEAQVWEALRDEARRILSVDGKCGGIALSNQPTVVLMVGVNGAGKTTTIGKLAQQLSQAGKKVTLAAGDTFRAAAVEQLKAWGQRVGCEVIAGKDGADPSSVLFDAIKQAAQDGADVVLADTAGRLQTKTNLMQEMTKIAKTIDKALPGAPHEVLLVIDSTNGQNALSQAKEFQRALTLSGLVLTKLDGTARGGAVLGICDALQVPVRYIGVGERTEDLYEFDIYAFIEALLGPDEGDISV